MKKKLIHFDIVSRYDKKQEPASIAVPLSPGEWSAEDSNHLAVVGKLPGEEQERCFPAQIKMTACWEDGSVKWLLIHFLADLPANEEQDYYLQDLGAPVQWGVDIVSMGRIGEVKEPENVILDNGILRIYLAAAGKDYLFERLETPEHLYLSEEIAGPFIRDCENREFHLRIGDAGWEILEQGPVRAVMRTDGKHVSNTAGNIQQWFDFVLTLTVWAGKPWIHLDYQFINKEDDKIVTERKSMILNNEQAGLKYDKDYPYEQMKEAYLTIAPQKKGSGASHGIYTSSFNAHSERGDERSALRNLVTADTILNTANEMFPEVLFSIYAADWRSDNFSFAAGIYQAFQNFPKALESSGEGVRLNLLPDMGIPLKVPQGVGKTTKCYLFFHNVELEENMLLDRLHQFEVPAVPVLEPEAYMEAGVFEGYVSNRYHHATERFLYRYVDSRSKGLGMLHFGDGPEWEYRKQGRSEGLLVWINNEYDMPHNFMVMLARSGDRRYFDYMRAAVEHWYDVDLCHYSNQPYKQGLLYTHSVDHVSGQPVPSHQWVEGFLDYYHLTGNPNGRQAALSIGEGLLNMMELPMYQAAAVVEPREIGWAMRTFIALYQETWDQKWLDACKPIVAVYIDWADKLGTFSTPYPDNYMDRVPFMIHVGLVGLYKYDQICPDSQVKRVILSVVDDMVSHCYIKRADMFFGKQYPAVRFLNLNGMVLESLAIAYELTNDRAYIEKGLGMFDWITQENMPPVYDFSKYKQDEYTVIYNCPTGPKRCAQTLLPLLHYYRYALDLGYLKNRADLL